MEKLNLELNHTYLLQFGNSDTLSSATILLVTDKAYLIRWNRDTGGNDTWELKSRMNKYYTVVEDISDYQIDVESQTLKAKTTWKDCPECQGRGWCPDDQITGGRKTCNCCWGSGKVVDVVEIV
jgi:hypothetical protein